MLHATHSVQNLLSILTNIVWRPEAEHACVHDSLATDRLVILEPVEGLSTPNRSLHSAIAHAALVVSDADPQAYTDGGV